MRFMPVRTPILPLCALLLFWLAAGPLLVQAQEYRQKPPTKTRILFLLDGSGSMMAQWENTLRINAARQVITELVDSIRIDNNVELGLRVYGHQSPRRYQNCQDTKLEVPFAPQNHQRIIQVVNTLKPQGVTPIAYSLQQAANDFPADPRYRNVIVIITDGIESCNGNPCQVSLSLQRKGIFLKPFVIGLGMDKRYLEQFSCLGRFIDARNIVTFKSALTTVIRTTLRKTSVAVELLDEQNRRRETDVNVTFLNNFTGQAAYEFVHYRNGQGMPDSVVVDPVLTYDLVVNTIPPVRLNKVNIVGGQHNVLPVVAPQGFLNMRQKNSQAYANGVKVLMRRAGTQEVVHAQDINTTQKYLAGNYDIAVLTLPPTYYNNVPVAPRATQTIEVPAPGKLNVYTDGSGFGSIYQYNNQGRQRWVVNLKEQARTQTVTLQPGRYKVVYRATNARGSKFTKIEDVTVKPGGAVTIKLFGL